VGGIICQALQGSSLRRRQRRRVRRRRRRFWPCFPQPQTRGLHSSTFSAQLKRFLWDRGCI
jgi:hypothetical protein